jgi:hypothetical protein
MLNIIDIIYQLVLVDCPFFLFLKVLASNIRLTILSHLPSHHFICLSSTGCRIGLIFKFSLKVEFLILSSLVFPSIFLKNLFSTLCILLFCICITDHVSEP